MSLAIAADVAGDGGPSVTMPAPGWEAFVELAVLDIARAGRSMPLVTAQLRAVLEDLLPNATPEQLPAIKRTIARLDAADRQDGGGSV